MRSEGKIKLLNMDCLDFMKQCENKVAQRLVSKEAAQESLMQAVKALITKHKK